MNTDTDKFAIQNNQYDFPYHYIPHVNNGIIEKHRVLSWGFEYMCYLLHCKQIVLKHRPRSLIDIGCGDGRFISLIKNDIEKILGVDLSTKAIGLARALNPEVEFQIVDINNYTSQYDVATLIEVLEHIPDEEMKNFLLSESSPK